MGPCLLRSSTAQNQDNKSICCQIAVGVSPPGKLEGTKRTKGFQTNRHESRVPVQSCRKKGLKLPLFCARFEDGCQDPEINPSKGTSARTSDKAFHEGGLLGNSWNEGKVLCCRLFEGMFQTCQMVLFSMIDGMMRGPEVDLTEEQDWTGAGPSRLSFLN